MSPDTLARLRRASARLRDPGSRGDVLALVLRFAAESFSRVAMFMVRDEQALAIAQLGLPKAGGPDDQAVGDVVVPAREPAWFRRVIDGRNPVRCPPDDDGDQRLAVLLGNALPREAYVAPIESANRIVALLYADNLPSRRADRRHVGPRGGAPRGRPRARPRGARARARRGRAGGRLGPEPAPAPPARAARPGPPGTPAFRARRRAGSAPRSSRKPPGGRSTPRPRVARGRRCPCRASSSSRTRRRCARCIASALEELEPAVKITEASSGFEALRLLPRGVFDLIVTDINMPDINGLELVSFVKKQPRLRARCPLDHRLDRGLRARPREGPRRSAPTRTW